MSQKRDRRNTLMLFETQLKSKDNVTCPEGMIRKVYGKCPEGYKTDSENPFCCEEYIQPSQHRKRSHSIINEKTQSNLNSFYPLNTNYANKISKQKKMKQMQKNIINEENKKRLKEVIERRAREEHQRGLQIINQLEESYRQAVLINSFHQKNIEAEIKRLEAEKNRLNNLELSESERQRLKAETEIQRLKAEAERQRLEAEAKKQRLEASAERQRLEAEIQNSQENNMNELLNLLSGKFENQNQNPSGGFFYTKKYSKSKTKNKLKTKNKSKTKKNSKSKSKTKKYSKSKT
jgi:hypothetical protein